MVRRIPLRRCRGLQSIQHHELRIRGLQRIPLLGSEREGRPRQRPPEKHILRELLEHHGAGYRRIDGIGARGLLPVRDDRKIRRTPLQPDGHVGIPQRGAHGEARDPWERAVRDLDPERGGEEAGRQDDEQRVSCGCERLRPLQQSADRGGSRGHGKDSRQDNVRSQLPEPPRGYIRSCDHDPGPCPVQQIQGEGRSPGRTGQGGCAPLALGERRTGHRIRAEDRRQKEGPERPRGRGLRTDPRPRILRGDGGPRDTRRDGLLEEGPLRQDRINREPGWDPDHRSAMFSDITASS